MAVDTSNLKREHNELILKGRVLLAEIEELAVKVNGLRDAINSLDPSEHDEIRLIFEGTYQDEK